jgi:hypothetical protein
MSCGCGCEPSGPITPEPVDNAPGLSTLRDRVARHSSVKAAILRGLADPDLPALAGLGARDDADPTIALADGFATMADVITFYNERIAHESYLRTATERLSVVELSRLIGYRPSPGVASDAWLAFTVEEAKTLPTQPAEPVQVPAGTQVQSVPGQDEQPVTFETTAPITARASWNAIPPVRRQQPQNLKGRTDFYIDRLGHRLVAGDVILVLGAERTTKPDNILWATRRLATVEEDVPRELTHITWTDPLKEDIPLEGASVHVFRLRAPIFGHNAPNPCLMSSTGTNLATKADLTNCEWLEFKLEAEYVDLDQPYNSVVEGGWVLVEGEAVSHLAGVSKVQFPSVSEYGLSSKTTRITLAPKLDVTKITLDPKLPDPTKFDRKNSIVLAQSEQLPLAPDLRTSAVEGDVLDLDLDLDGTVELAPGQPLAIYGPAHGSPKGAQVLSEVVLIDDEPDAVDPSGGITTIRLASRMKRAYDRSATTINANVAPATEGATVSEILGGGDATQPNQAFTLKQRPLTWSDDDDTGLEPALEVRVDDVAWHRRATLYTADPQDRVYVVETHDDGATLIRFGDGVEGTRLPTGQANLRARYRTGLGARGNVRTGQLTTLLSRPLGITAAGNPAPGTGGEDPEALEQARGNAPVTVRTLDRVVSRLDVEDYARAYPGVLKASAVWVPTGPARGISLTVMGPGGAAIDQSVRRYHRLLAALRGAASVPLPIRLLSYRPVPLAVALRVLPDPDYKPDLVLSQVSRDLLAAYAPDARELGQPTSVDEVVAIAHRTPGVIAVDVDVFRRRDDAPLEGAVQDRVPAHPGGLDPTGTGVVPAEFLTLSTADLSVELMT